MTRPQAAPSWILGAHLRPFASALRARGVEPEQALQRVGLTRSVLNDAYGRIPRARFLQFLRVSEELSGDSNLGLHAGELVQVEDFDILGMLLRSSPSVHVALERLQQGATRWESHAEIRLDSATLVFGLRSPGAMPPPRAEAEYFSALRMSAFSKLVGETQPIAVRFMHPRPRDTSEHERIFHAPLRFNADETALVLPRELMSAPMKQADPELARVLARHVRRMFSAITPVPKALPERVRQLLTDALPTGQTTILRIAALLHTSESTLRRQLREHGTSYQTVLDELRRDLALQHVHGPACSVTEIASSLGFADTGAFYRAFKRWTGTNVSDYRHGAAPEGSVPRTGSGSLRSAS